MPKILTKSDRRPTMRTSAVVASIRAEVAGPKLVNACGPAPGRRDSSAYPSITPGPEKISSPTGSGRRSGSRHARVQPEPRAGDRPPDGVRVPRRQRRRQHGHPGGRLGLAVHHRQTPATGLTAVGDLPDAVGAAMLHRPARSAGDRAGRASRRPWTSNTSIRWGVAGSSETPVPGDLVGEIRIGDGPVAQHDRPAGPKLRMEDREAEAVVQRQRGDRAIRRQISPARRRSRRHCSPDCCG